MCVDVPSEVCHEIPDQKCAEKPYEKCREEPRETCIKVTNHNICIVPTVTTSSLCRFTRRCR